MNALSQVVVLVEGFDDRAFWSGMLQACFGFNRSDAVEPSTLPPALISTLRTEKAPGRYAYVREQELVVVIPFQAARGPEPMRALFDRRMGHCRCHRPVGFAR